MTEYIATEEIQEIQENLLWSGLMIETRGLILTKILYGLF